MHHLILSFSRPYKKHQISVTLPTISGYLHLCEIQMIEDGPDLCNSVSIFVILAVSVLAAENHRHQITPATLSRIRIMAKPVLLLDGFLVITIEFFPLILRFQPQSDGLLKIRC